MELPAGMWFYSFLFDDKHLLPGHLAAGRLPAPSSLAVGVAVGLALTAIRFALDFVVLKVRMMGLRWPRSLSRREGVCPVPPAIGVVVYRRSKQLVLRVDHRERSHQHALLLYACSAGRIIGALCPLSSVALGQTSMYVLSLSLSPSLSGMKRRAG